MIEDKVLDLETQMIVHEKECSLLWREQREINERLFKSIDNSIPEY